MTKPGSLFLGRSTKAETLALKYANRHGLIAGATGTGKTVTLQIMAEGFSAAGVPVFVSDVKGDLSGMACAGEPKDFLFERAETIKLDPYEFYANPVVFWDLFGKKGHPIRTTISEMGPILLSRLLNLNETQEGVLNIAFRLADEEGLLLLDLKDLRSLLAYVGEISKELTIQYGSVSKRSIGAIQRRLLTLETQGGKQLFGEPALKLENFLTTDENGRGTINILSAEKLFQSPKLYSTFLLWLLSELFEELPEVGDPKKPKLVFFFDEAHLLFDDAPKALIDQVEQVVRLIRSKGVGVYFVTQNPTDVPEDVASQLGNRVQHALRAFTPKDQRGVKAAADTFRPNPKFDAARAVTELGVGEALVSTLMAKGVPSVVERTLIRPPASRLGPAKPKERAAVIADSPLKGIYDKRVDRKSAFERLQRRAQEAADAEAEHQEEREREKSRKRKARTSTNTRKRSTRKRRSNRQTVAEATTKSLFRSVASSIGRELGRTLVGILKKSR